MKASLKHFLLSLEVFIFIATSFIAELESLDLSKVWVIALVILTGLALLVSIVVLLVRLVIWQVLI